MKSWHSSLVSAEERRVFLEEIMLLDVRRTCWVLAVYFPIVAGFLIYNAISRSYPGMISSQLFDVPLEPLFFVLALLALKPGTPLPWRRAIVIAYYIFCLATMDCYYFSSHPYFGESPTYALGVVLPAVVLVLPPGEFLAMLLGNHAVFVALVLGFKFKADDAFSAILNGTTGVILAILATWFLFLSKWNEFQKERIIVKRNEELAAANALLRESYDEMNEIMAIAAHDLRSPLHSVKALLEISRCQPEWSREPHAGVVDAVTRTCGNMLSLVGSLLDAYTAEHRDGPSPAARFDLTRSVAAAASKNQMAATSKQIRLETDLPQDTPSANGDATAIEEAISNLISNAVKFSPLGSTVVVALFQESGSWCIEVRDNGPGIPDDEHGNLFRKFHRGKNRPTAGEPGTGLGLFIARKLVESGGGSLRYLPRDPGGSIFKIQMAS